MPDKTYLIIIGLFLLYYLFILIFERRFVQDPKTIIEKFLSVILLYAGVSLIYFSITGQPFLYDSPETYSIYIFIIGFIAVLWTIPNLLEEFKFFERFLKDDKGKGKKKALKRR